MHGAVLVLQVVLTVFLLWGAFLCLARRDRRASFWDRRGSARVHDAGRRREDRVRVADNDEAGADAVARQPLPARVKRLERYAA
jgi:hypothetical protein